MTKQCKHLKTKESEQVIILLKKYGDLFDGTLFMWNTTPMYLELRNDAKPVCLKTYPVPRVYEAVFRKEFERRVNLGVLEEANNSKWGAPSFYQTKAKTNCVRFLSDFLNLNRQLKCKPYPMPKIREMLLNIEGFKYASSLYLNMVPYHIRLREYASNLCTIILTWIKYRYKRLLTRVSNSPDIFQDKMNAIFCCFRFIGAYIDALLIITKGDWSDHLEKLE